MKRKAIKLLCSLSQIMLLASCSVSSTSRISDYNEDKNVYIKKTGHYLFTLKPYSSERLAGINYDSISLTEEEKDSVLNDYSNFLCFAMEITIDDFSGDITNYNISGKDNNDNKKVNYYLFDMQNSLSLKAGEDEEIPCTIYYYERMNDITGTNRFVIGFRKSDARDLTLEYENPYLDCGKIKFNLDKKHLAFK